MDDELTNYSFNSTNLIKVSPRYKEGYVLEGFYTQSGGGGTKMLDWDGSCLSSSFSGDGSTVLYPKYSTIDMSYEFVTKTYYYEEPQSVGYNFYGNPKIFSLSLLGRDGFDYIQKVAMGNPELEVRVSADAEFNGGAATFAIGVGNDSATKANLSSSMSFSQLSSYEKNSVFTTVKCKALSIKDPNVLIGVTCNSAKNTYVKNVQFKIKFVKAQ